MAHLILLYGQSATGKTHLSRRLSKDLHLPVLGVDRVKEMLWDNGFPDETNKDIAKVVGGMSFQAVLAITAAYLASGNSLILDLHRREDLVAVKTIAEGNGAVFYAIKLVIATEALRHQRYNERLRGPDRHPGHNDSEDDHNGPPRAYVDIIQPDRIIDTTDFGEETYQALLTTLGGDQAITRQEHPEWATEGDENA